MRDRPWRLVCAGALDLAPEHVATLRERCRDAGIADRVVFTGALDAQALDREYAAADLLVVASRIETYGLVVTEALARAVPVVATGGRRPRGGDGQRHPPAQDDRDCW